VDNVRISGIPNKSKLRYLGNCFKSEYTDGTWKISAKYEQGPLRPVKRLDFGMLPFLALHREYNKDANPRFESHGYRAEFTLPSVAMWKRRQLVDCPLVHDQYTPPENQFQRCFHFSSGGYDIWLPALELARILFFASAYMARLSFQPNGLDHSFLVTKKSAGVTEITMLPGANFSKYYFQREAYRAHLSWLLINPELRISFDSIYKNRIQNQIEASNSVRWVFDFDPPDISGCALIVRGRRDAKAKQFFVYEVMELSGIRSGIEGEVDFIHPDVRDSAGDPTKGTGERFRPTHAEMDLDAEKDASVDNHHFIAPTPAVGLLFRKPIKTRIVKKGHRITGRGREAEEEGPSVIASILEGIDSGSLPQADISQLETNIDTSDLEEKFSLFNNLIRLLAETESLEVISANTLRLPEIGRCLMYLNENGSRRHYKCVVVRLADGRIRHILEVDTSDAKKALATKILEFRDQRRVVDGLHMIMGRLVKRSLLWPQKTIAEYCRYNRSVPHPSSKIPGCIDREALAHWRDRIVSWLQEP